MGQDTRRSSAEVSRGVLQTGCYCYCVLLCWIDRCIGCCIGPSVGNWGLHKVYKFRIQRAEPHRQRNFIPHAASIVHLAVIGFLSVAIKPDKVLSSMVSLQYGIDRWPLKNPFQTSLQPHRTVCFHRLFSPCRHPTDFSLVSPPPPPFCSPSNKPNLRQQY